jgi:hypothetical protein
MAMNMGMTDHPTDQASTAITQTRASIIVAPAASSGVSSVQGGA